MVKGIERIYIAGRTGVADALKKEMSMQIDLSIQKLKNEKYHRPWLIKREGGDYRQHAHLKTKEDAERVRGLILQGKKAPCRDYRIAMQRILTAEEYGKLDKIQRYHRPGASQIKKRSKTLKGEKNEHSK